MSFLRALVMVCALVALSPLPASAERPLVQEQEDLDELTAVLSEPVVSGVSRSAESSSTAPATVTVLTAEDLRRYGLRSLDEALNFLSLGMVTQNPLHSVDIGSRGVLLTSDFGNHVLLLLNGQILNEPWNGTAYFERGAAVPWELIDHIEVILGPGSVMYGSNAMLGVINVVTRKARDYGRGLVTVETEVSAPVNARARLQGPRLQKRYFSDAGTGIRVAGGGSQGFHLLGKKAEIVGQLEYFSAEGPSFTFGPQAYGDDLVTGQPKNFGPRSQPGVWGGVARNSYSTRVPAGHVRLSVGDLQVELRAATYSRSTPYINNFNVFTGDFDAGDTERDRFFNTDIRYRLPTTGRLTLSARLYGGLYDYRQRLTQSAAEDCPSTQTGGCFKTVNGDSKWIGLELQAHRDWLGDGRVTTLLGTDGRLRRVAGRSEFDGFDQTAQVAMNGYARGEEILGLYLQQEARPVRWLTLNLGGRLDLDSRFGRRLSPRAAVAFHTSENGTAKLSYAEAFRGPTAYELYYSDLGQIAPGSLRPETVRSLEASHEQRWGEHRLLIGGFVSRWTDMVLLTDVSDEGIQDAIINAQLAPGTTSAVQYSNVANIRNLGLNAAVEGRIARRLSYGLNVTAARTRRSSGDGSTLRLAVSPQVFGNARLAYEIAPDAPTLALAAFFASKRPADRALDGGFSPTPEAPAQVDLRFTLTGPLRFLQGLSYRFTAQYAFAGRMPYVAGPIQVATPEFPAAELAPIDRLRLGFQLTQRFK